MKDAKFFEARTEMDQATGCLNWTKAKTPAGYGQFTDKQPRRRVYAHRSAWEVERGPIPDGMFICHKCDNPSCVNVDHLFLGTAADNIADMHSKGRGHKARGSSSGMSKLTEHDVSIIKWCLDAGVKGTKLAALYGVTSPAIYDIRKGATWRHVPAMEYGS